MASLTDSGRGGTWDTPLLNSGEEGVESGVRGTGGVRGQGSGVVMVRGQRWS